MNRPVTGALLLLLVGLLIIGAAYFLKPYFQEKEQRSTSDAREIKGNIKIAVDNWVGYFPLCSPEMKKRMRQQGWNLVCEDDQADYPQRMKRLKDGEIDFAVATVDAFLLNGAPKGFPGTIVAVIDESQGGDAIVARKDAVASLNELKGRTDIKVAFTPGSPSHHLLKAATEHFDVPELLPAGERLIATKGSEEALKKLLSGKAQVAALWEPDVSRALARDGIVKLLGTEDTKRLIVDVLLAGRDFSKSRPEVVKLLLANYFMTLKSYRENQELLQEHVMAAAKLTGDTVEKMLKGVAWTNLTDNCERWFGISMPGSHAEDSLIETLESTAQILIHSGDFPESPIPAGDPYRLTQSQFVEDLYLQGIAGFTSPKAGSVRSDAVNSLEAAFAPLSADAWGVLQEIGTLRTEPVVFQSGTADLSFQGKLEIDRAVERLKHYPNFRVVIKGHTGTEGAPEANRTLSRERSEAVARYLQVTYNINPNRLLAVGFGGEKPLPQKPGESMRSYRYRLPRVELVLVREVY
jgi:outer membrane protein OmpA-like peptidoglycan-associated protein/ABC-type nitrate/sulfonate/bicarbonate transport system substrate-binding protein